MVVSENSMKILESYMPNSYVKGLSLSKNKRYRDWVRLSEDNWSIVWYGRKIDLFIKLPTSNYLPLKDIAYCLARNV